MSLAVRSNLQIKQNKNLSKKWNSFDPLVLKIKNTYSCRYVFKKLSGGKLGKAAQEV